MLRRRNKRERSLKIILKDKKERAIVFIQHGLTIAHVRVALTLASIILQGDSDLTIWSDTI